MTIQYFIYNHSKNPNDRRLYATACDDPKHIIGLYKDYDTKLVPSSCVKRIKNLPKGDGWNCSIKLSEIMT